MKSFLTLGQYLPEEKYEVHRWVNFLSQSRSVQVLSSGIDFLTEHIQNALEEVRFHKEAKLQFHVYRSLVPSARNKTAFFLRLDVSVLSWTLGDHRPYEAMNSAIYVERQRIIIIRKAISYLVFDWK
jgi:hypothetical protein